jgi:Rod binding domain-containing protein
MKVESIASAALAAAPTAKAEGAGAGPAATSEAKADEAAGGPKALAGGAKSGDSTQGVKHFAEEFERMLLMQMLRSSKICGDEKGYGSMLVDALADGVMKGGGLGLSEVMVRSLERSLAASQGSGKPAEDTQVGEKAPVGEKTSPSASSPGPPVRSSG